MTLVKNKSCRTCFGTPHAKFCHITSPDEVLKQVQDDIKTSDAELVRHPRKVLHHSCPDEVLKQVQDDISF